MNKFLVVVSILITSNIMGQSFEVSSFFSNSSQKGIIEGVILDNETNNKPLAFAEIKVKETGINTTSNINGLFKLRLKPNTYTLVVSFIGYESIEIENVKVDSNGKITKEVYLKTLKSKLTLRTELH